VKEEEGGAFGLKSLLLGLPIEYSVIAVTPVDAFSFSSDAFSNALRDHPKARTRIRSITMDKYRMVLQE
jgi:CRP-like cAMP-binding protein